MALRLDDVLRRRSHIAMFDTESAAGAAEQTAIALGQRLGWDDARVKREATDFARSRRAELRICKEVS